MDSITKKKILRFAAIISAFTAATICQNKKAVANYEAELQSVKKVESCSRMVQSLVFISIGGGYTVSAYANGWYPRNMGVNGSPENTHHKKIYSDVSQRLYNNFITGAKDRQGNFVQFGPKLKPEGE
jgi:alpha-L-fucosidase